MTDTIYHQEKIKSPSDNNDGKWITAQFMGEHHMGADRMEFEPSEPIGGVKRFFTTNGNAFYNQQDSCFYIYDSNMIIQIDGKNWSARYSTPPEKMTFGGMSYIDKSPQMSLYTLSGTRSPNLLPLEKMKWTNGLGQASQGLFPSAYIP